MTEYQKVQQEFLKWLREEIKKHWGTRCRTYCSSCATCVAWKHYDKAAK